MLSIGKIMIRISILITTLVFSMSFFTKADEGNLWKKVSEIEDFIKGYDKNRALYNSLLKVMAREFSGSFISENIVLDSSIVEVFFRHVFDVNSSTDEENNKVALREYIQGLIDTECINDVMNAINTLYDNIQTATRIRRAFKRFNFPSSSSNSTVTGDENDRQSQDENTSGRRLSIISIGGNAIVGSQ